MKTDRLIERQGALSANIVAFCRYLRVNGLPNGPAEESDALRAMRYLDFTDADEMRICLRAILTRKRSHQIRFDELYISYWRNLEKALNSKEKSIEEEAKQQAKKNARGPSLESVKNWLYNKAPEEEVELASFSPVSHLGIKDFSGFGDEEIAALRQLIQQLARKMATLFLRRYERSRIQQKLDLRRSLRLNLRRGGEILELVWKKRKIHKLKLYVICDVSKSMDLYARFLIQFMFAFQKVYHRIEVFVFSTSLYRVSEQMKAQSFDQVLDQLSEEVPGWSGGTRIGASLNQLLTEYGKGLDHRTVLLMLSDGWDTGEPELLESVMKQIQRKAHKVVWLNPLAGNSGFSPETQGMKTAMPYIDFFAPAHNLDSLRKAIKQIGQM